MNGDAAADPVARDGPRPTLVLLHGVGGGAAGFAPLVEAFTRLGWPASAWSQPGYDGTVGFAPYDLDACARRLREDLDRRRIGPVVLVGHSMGGMLAQALWRLGRYGRPARAGDPDVPAGSAPDSGFRIVGLVLAHTSAAFGGPDGDFQRRFVASRTRPLDEGRSMHDVAVALVPTLVAPAAPDAAIAAGIATMAAVPPATYRLAVAALATFDARDALPTISVPTLCLAAAHDKTSPPAVLERMAGRIPSADFHCLEGLGHLAPIEQPSRWAAEVAAWCERRMPAIGDLP